MTARRTLLTARQQKAIPILIATRTLQAAAPLVGVSRFTLGRWLTLPAFQEAYRDARHVLMDEAFSLLQKSCVQAVEVMTEILENPESPDMVRLRAAHMVLDIAVRGRAVQELEARIVAVEQLSFRGFADAD